MKGKIGTRALSVLLALLLVSAMVVPKEVTKISEPDEISNPLYVSKDMQKAIIEGIKDSDIATSQKHDLIKTLKEIWAGKSDLSDTEQQQVMKELSSILLTSTEVGIEWTGYYPWDPSWNHWTLADVHNDMAKLAGEKMGLSSTYCNILRDYASEPDTWFGDQVFHYKISGAAIQAENRAISAHNYIRNLGNPTEGYKQLSYSMHYMSDLSNPYHYSPVFLINHGKYEEYVGDNWHSGDNYYSDVYNDGYYYYITDVSDAANNLANVCNQYFSYINSEVSNDPDGFGDDPTLISYTRTCLIHGIRYDAGLVNWVNR